MKNKFFFVLLVAFHASFVFAQTRKIDYLNADFHKQRRDALRKKMPTNSVAVFFANPVRNRANDVDYVYHQDPNFYYLTGYMEPHAVLLIFKEKQSSENGEEYNEVLFVQPKDKYQEMWAGRRLGVEGTKEKLKFEYAFNNIAFENYRIDFSKFDKVLFYDFLNDVRDTKARGDLYDLISWFKSKASIPSKNSITIEKSANNLNTKKLDKLMHDLRGVKTKEEIDLLKRAIDISCIGQVEVMKSLKPGMSEREVQGIHEFIYKKYGAEYEGYPSIVGAGENGCFLHYIANNKKNLSANEMILMDLGAEYHGYTADITRTIPVNGKFSPEQKAIYDLVYKAQQAAIEAAKPGMNLRRDLDANIARRIINEGLVELGIIEHVNQRHLYYPHGLGHHIGLDVHDKGNYDELEENMVITIEPGIYIPKRSKCDQKWWGIAVRIEDDILITKDGHELLSDLAPRKSEEIEAMMKKKSILNSLKLPDLD